MSSKSRSRYHRKSIQRSKNDVQGAHLVPEGSQMKPQRSPRATPNRSKINKFGPKVDKMSTWASDLAPGSPGTPKVLKKGTKNRRHWVKHHLGMVALFLSGLRYYMMIRRRNNKSMDR